MCVKCKLQYLAISSSHSSLSLSLLCTFPHHCNFSSHISLSLHKSTHFACFFRGNCSAYMCVHEKRISHNIDLYASLLSSHSRKRRRMFDVQGIFHSFASASPSNDTPKKKSLETKNCIFFMLRILVLHSYFSIRREIDGFTA